MSWNLKLDTKINFKKQSSILAVESGSAFPLSKLTERGIMLDVELTEPHFSANKATSMTNAANVRIRKRGLGRQTISYVARNCLNVFSIGLLLVALFYFVQIQQLRHAALSNNPELFVDDEIVTVTRAIDGDEVRVRNSSGSTRVRILGIMSFDSTERDLMLAEYGQIAFDYLEEEIVGKEARLKLAEKRVDNEGRLLATLLVGASHDSDVAQTMVANGLTLVYTKFPFPAMDEYLKTQDAAKAEQLGFWQSQRVSARAESMLDLWNQERRNR